MEKKERSKPLSNKDIKEIKVLLDDAREVNRRLENNVKLKEYENYADYVIPVIESNFRQLDLFDLLLDDFMNIKKKMREINKKMKEFELKGII